MEYILSLGCICHEGQEEWDEIKGSIVNGQYNYKRKFKIEGGTRRIVIIFETI